MYNCSLSNIVDVSACSNNSWIDNMLLYGSTMELEYILFVLFINGNISNVWIDFFLYVDVIWSMIFDPKPDPVPPEILWFIRNPWK